MIMRRLFVVAALLACLVPQQVWAACANPLVITTQPSGPTTGSWTGFSDSGGNCMLGSVPMPTTSSAGAITPQVMSAVGSNLVAKASAGNFYGFIGTTGSTPGCFFVFNATSLPANGTVTPLLPPIQAAANTTVTLNMGSVPAAFSTGITVGFSSTCGFTLTASATAIISAQVQ